MPCLQKGNNVSLSKLSENLKTLTVTVAWVKKSHDETEFDIDASAFLLTVDKKIRSDADFIFYNQPESANQSVQLVATSLEKQQFTIDLTKIPSDIDSIAFVLTLHEAKERQQNFSQLDRIEVNVTANNNALVSYVLEQTDKETALILVELYRHQLEWKIRAVGQGFFEGLDILARHFGVEIDEPASQEDTAPPQKPATIVRYIETITPAMRSYQDKLKIAQRCASNESKTRLLIDLMLTKALGYHLENISTEHRLPKRSVRLDYMLSLNGKNVLIVEAKAITEPLKEAYVSQVTSYAYYAQLDFALLTNGIEWQLYYIERKKLKKYQSHLVFAINLFEFDDQAGENLFFISRFGIQENSLDTLKLKMKALNSLPDVLLQPDMVKCIAEAINQQHSACKVTENEVARMLDKMLD